MHGKVTSGKVMDSLLIEMDPYIRRFTQKLDISWVPPQEGNDSKVTRTS